MALDADAAWPLKWEVSFLLIQADVPSSRRLILALGAAMTSLILVALLAASASPSAVPSAPPLDCRAERITLLKSIQPLVVLEATLQSRPDNNPNTVEFFIVAGMPIGSGTVSEDGQAIYVPGAAMSGPNEDPQILARLFGLAIDRLLVLKIGKVCSPLQVPASST